MSGVIHIYGASDDLIEVAGALSEEFNPPNRTEHLVATCTGALIRLRMTETWEARVVRQPVDPALAVTIVVARGEDEGRDEHGCPGYADRVDVPLPAGSVDRDLWVGLVGAAITSDGLQVPE